MNKNPKETNAKQDWDRKCRLRKDIVIPAGTLMRTAPQKTERYGYNHVETTIALTNDMIAEFHVCLELLDDRLDEYFEFQEKQEADHDKAGD